MNPIKKYKALSDPVKASLWFLVCGFLQKAISMITTPIFTRILTSAEYGKYNVYQSWFSIISLIAGLNLAAGVYTRGLIKYEEDKERFSSSLLGLSITSTVICLLIYLPFQSFFNNIFDLSTFFVLCMFINLFMSAVFHFWSSRQRVDYKYKRLVALTLLNVILSPLFGVLMVYLSPENYKVEARVLAIIIIDVILFGWIYISIFKKGKTFFHKGYWKYALAFNLPLIPHYLSQVVLSHSDRIMIKDICGASAAGIYSVAYSLGYIMHIFNSSVSQSMNPWIYKSIKEGKLKSIAKVSYLVLLLLAAVNVALIIAAPEIVYLMAPEEYHSAIYVIPPIAASVFFMFMYNLFATFEYYYEKTKFVMVASFIGAALNVGLNYVFLHMFKSHPLGFIAAGYTSLFCYICYSLGHYVFMRRVNRKCMNGTRVYDPKILVGMSVLFLLVCAGATLLYPYPIIRWGLIAVLMIVAFIFRKRLISLFAMMKKKKAAPKGN